LEELGKQPGTLALIFGKAQNKFDSHRLMAMLTLRAPCGRPISGGDCQDPAKLRRVIVDLIDNEVAVEANFHDQCRAPRIMEDTAGCAGQRG
ncbi:MAG: hypothetical protein WCA12_02530, partial [Burkholderiales bacterium]